MHPSTKVSIVFPNVCADVVVVSALNHDCRCCTEAKSMEAAYIVVPYGVLSLRSMLMSVK